MSEIALLSSLRARNMSITPDWLSVQVDDFRNENPHRVNDYRELEKYVYKKYLCCDLRTLRTSSLPENLCREKKNTLRNNVILQLLTVVDISKPKLWQLQRIRNDPQKPLDADESEKNNEYTANSKRCLLLTLTDGLQEINAMEYQSLKSLSLDLTPGMKIKFIPTLQIRRGQIVLEKDSNIELLGGNVKELQIVNAPENVLAAALKLPLTDHPNQDKKSNTIRAPSTSIQQTANLLFGSDNLDDDFEMLVDQLPAQPNTLVISSNSANDKKTNTKSLNNKVVHSRMNSNNRGNINDPLGDNLDFMLDIEDSIRSGNRTGRTKACPPSQIETAMTNRQNTPSNESKLPIKSHSNKPPAQNNFDEGDEDIDFLLQLEERFNDEESVIEKIEAVKDDSVDDFDKYLQDRSDLSTRVKRRLISDSSCTSTKPTKSNENSQPSTSKSKKSTQDVAAKLKNPIIDMMGRPGRSKQSNSVKLTTKVPSAEETVDLTQTSPMSKEHPRELRNISPIIKQSPLSRPRSEISRELYISPTVTKTSPEQQDVSPVLKQSPLSRLESVGISEVSATPCVKFTPIERLLHMQVTRGKFQVHAKFKGVKHKLEFDQEWRMQITVADSTDKLDVWISNDVIEGIMGITAAGIKQLSDDPALYKRTFFEVIQKVKTRISTLNGAIEITFKDKIPSITNL